MNDSDKPGDAKFPLTNNAPRAKMAPGAPSPSPPPPVRRPRPFFTFLKRAFVVGVCAASIAGGTVAGNLYNRNPYIRDIVGQIAKNPAQLFTGNPLAEYTPEKQFPGVTQLNVMLLGCDVDYQYDKPVVLKDHNGRSDAIMVAHVDFVNKTIKVLSIPRDTAVHIPDHGVQKVNAAHAFGGPALTAQTLREAFNIPTDNFVTLNFVAFQKVVDAVGGVDVDVKGVLKYSRRQGKWIHAGLDYDDNWGNLHVHLPVGPQHLNGYQSMGFVRIRHSDDDLARAERQHEFLESLRSRVASPVNFLRLPDVLNAVTDNVKHDMTEAQMLTLANFARSLPRENISLATMPSDEGPSYVYVRPNEARKVIADTFYNGDDTLVSINVPGRRVLLARAEGTPGRRLRRRHTPLHSNANIPRDDNGDPLVDEQTPVDEAAVPPDADVPAEGRHLRHRRHASDASTTPSDPLLPPQTKPDVPADTPHVDPAPHDSGPKDTGGPSDKDTGSPKDGGKDSGDGGKSGGDGTGTGTDGKTGTG